MVAALEDAVATVARLTRCDWALGQTSGSRIKYATDA